MLFEVGEECFVSEVLQAGCIVCHHVGHSWDEVAVVAVSVLPLVHAGEVAEVGGGPIRGHSAFVHPGHCRRVVGAIHESGVGGVMVVANDVDLAQLARVFQVTIGDGSMRI